MPVTTQGACDCGVEIWGFPKIVARTSDKITLDDVERITI
jgi:hypothetical protein